MEEIGGTVTVNRSYVLTILNDVGGTTDLPAGVYRVRVDRVWHDYEIGTRMRGVLTEPRQVDIARNAGMTPWPGKVPFHPDRVYFAGSDFVQDPDGTAAA